MHLGYRKCIMRMQQSVFSHLIDTSHRNSALLFSYFFEEKENIHTNLILRLDNYIN